MHRDIICIGASAGGVQTIEAVTSALPADLRAAVFVAIHVPPESPGRLPEILSRRAALPAAHATNDEKLQMGRIYVAPPGHHLFIEKTKLKVSIGPRENRHRPSIDVMFRSAALAHGTRTMGVVLSGSLDDGTAGLAAIQSVGGLCIVQDPAEATFPSMPRSALLEVPGALVLRMADMGAEIARLAREPITRAPTLAPSVEMRLENRMAAGEVGLVSDLGKPSGLSCPECGGSLFEVRGAPPRYRCHVGHAYSSETLFADQATKREEALWAAVRSFTETAAMARRLAGRARARQSAQAAESFDRRAEQADAHALVIRGLIQEEPEAAAE